MNWFMQMLALSFSAHFGSAFLAHYSSSSTNGSSSIHYTFTSLAWCLESRKEFLIIYGISVEQCVFECAMRSDCGSLGYIKRGRLNICQMHFKRNLYRNSTNGTGKCIFIRREDMDIKEVETLCTCGNGKACAFYSGQCLFAECKYLTFDNGYVYGNIRNIYAKVRIECDDGYIESNGLIDSTCQPDGNWSYIPTCVLRPVVSTTSTDSSTTNDDTTVTSLTQTTITTEVTAPNEDKTPTATPVTAEATSITVSKTTIEATSFEMTTETTSTKATTTPAILNTEESSKYAPTTEITSIETTSTNATSTKATTTIATISTDETITHAQSTEITSIATTSTEPATKLNNNEGTAIETTRAEVGITEATTTKTNIGLEDTTTTQVPMIVCPSISGEWLRPRSDPTFEVSINIASFKQSAATSACTGLSSSLVKIDIEWKQTFLSEVLSQCEGYKNTDCYWVDGSKTGSSWQFSDASAMPTDNKVFWNTGGPPTSGGVSCVAINDNQRWIAKNCNNKCGGYICER